MIPDDELEELCADGAQVFTLGQSMSDFIDLMQESYHNVPPYILRVVFISMLSHSDLQRES